MVKARLDVDEQGRADGNVVGNRDGIAGRDDNREGVVGNAATRNDGRDVRDGDGNRDGTVGTPGFGLRSDGTRSDGTGANGLRADGTRAYNIAPESHESLFAEMLAALKLAQKHRFDAGWSPAVAEAIRKAEKYQADDLQSYERTQGTDRQTSGRQDSEYQGSERNQTSGRSERA